MLCQRRTASHGPDKGLCYDTQIRLRLLRHCAGVVEALAPGKEHYASCHQVGDQKCVVTLRSL